MIVLETKNLVKRFDGVKAINKLSLAISKGKIFGVIGPNGSGKTTLVNVLSGMLSSDSGRIFIKGLKMQKIKPHEVSLYGIARTFQSIRLFEQMTVLDNILVVLTKKNVFSSLFERHIEYHLIKAEEILKKINLWQKRNQLANNLSYGQRKLLEIGRAIAMKSDILFFDEPFAGLFPKMRNIVASIIQKLKQENKTVILIEHDIDLIRYLCDYVFVMDNGQLLAKGEPNQVLSNRKVIKVYLGK